jgi:hypothetical protein
MPDEAGQLLTTELKGKNADRMGGATAIPNVARECTQNPNNQERREALSTEFTENAEFEERPKLVGGICRIQN